MAARRIALLAATGLALVLGGCGDDENPAFSDDTREQLEAEGQARIAEIEAKVRQGELPPVARMVINPDGTTNINFIDGPKQTEDIVRSSDDGTSGPRLEWDLDGDGKVERNITELQLYEATTH